ncbi:hypothetical protein DFH08DRAFT_699735 [Mycena albidolilacea]|uniref:Uncharacterized protein n=1 Tax=Mycena albidolilacea TaxID=1033008 RepID=A0AAD7A175_9AGAR|nr:hypothetical protein DFH08DRAFT_699735 [Mycena albidolilacea]
MVASTVNLDPKAIESNISRFAETSKALMKGLDVLGQLHPFINIAVLAFKGVAALEIARRDNNKKVLAIKSQMQDMMVVLFQLREIHDPEELGPDDETTLKDRMAGLMETIATDIERCGNTCDVYTKKGFLAKALKSKIYEDRLAKYVQMFDEHKRELQFRLQVHTARTVDHAKKKLDGQEAHLKLILQKMEELFRKLDTPREREVLTFIKDNRGAQACLDNDATLSKLISKSGESITSFDPTNSGKGDLASARKLLSAELVEDVTAAVNKNFDNFSRKSKQLADTILAAISDGAKIRDKDLQTLWNDQGWKGSVKARTFVLSLNDYYENFRMNKDIPATESVVGSAPPSPILSPTSLEAPRPALSEDDRWALSYINAVHLQPILEAVDDDGSGFVSVTEANNFALKRPKGWSLLQWVAFWAAGWHPTVTWYKNRIYNILYSMNSLLKLIHPANAQFADKYFAGPGIRRVERLLRSAQSAPSKVFNDEHLKHIAEEFRTREEDKLETKLEGLLYELDDSATIRGITGHRRIERYIFPLLYLLLGCHLDILQIACIHVLDEAEFNAMKSALSAVFAAVEERINSLEAVFKSKSLDVKDRIGHFAFGMVYISNNTIIDFTEEDGYEWEDEGEHLGPDSDDEKEEQKTAFNRVPVEILRHEPPPDICRGVYDLEKRYTLPETPMSEVDGFWIGRSMLPTGLWGAVESLVLIANGNLLTGGLEYWYSLDNVTGILEEGGNVVFSQWAPSGTEIVCTGQYDPDTLTIKGTYQKKINGQPVDGVYAFSYHRTPAYAWRFRYNDSELAENPARARWRFAINAILDEVQRAGKSRSYVIKCFQEAKRWVELVKRDRTFNRNLSPATPLTSEESKEMQHLKDTVLRPCDARFFSLVVDFELQKMVIHERSCDECKRLIHGIRQFCIQCMDDGFSDWIDLCTNCLDKTPQRNGFTHLSSHLQVKVYVRLHDGEMACVVPVAKDVAERVKKWLRLTASTRDEAPKPADSPADDALKTNGQATNDSKPPMCACCREPISPPCFVCARCNDDVYICMSCDAKRLLPHSEASEAKYHKLWEPLIYIHNIDPIPDVISKDTQMEMISSLDTRMTNLDSRIEALEQKLENRFQVLEGILRGFGEKLVAAENVASTL